MPQAKDKPSRGLSINLNDGKLFYSPGDEISGSVTLDTVEDLAIGSVNLDFYGRAKVRYERSTGQGTVVYRGRALLFANSETLFSDYHTHKPGSWSWPFKLQLPRTADPDVVRDTQRKWSQNWEAANHFIPTDDLVSDRTLPPTFRISKWRFGWAWHAFVEYVIQVSVQRADGAGLVSRSTSKMATMPILVRSIATSGPNQFNLPCTIPFRVPEGPIEKMNSRMSQDSTALDSRQTRHMVQTSNLLNNSPDRNRSLTTAMKDKTRLFFSSDALPRYSFDFTVKFPRTAQLLKPNNIRLRVSAATVYGPQSTTVDSDNTPKITIANVSMSVIIKTYARYKSLLSGPSKVAHEEVLLDKLPINHVMALDSYSLAQDSRSGQAIHDIPDDVVDLSTMPGWNTSLVAAKAGRKLENPLAESFTTYIIGREYRLKYTIELEVAGEKIRVTNGGQDHIVFTPPDAADLEALMKSKSATALEAEDEDDSDNEGPSTKRSKADEAAEERSAAESSQHAGAQETLPAYEQVSSSLEFRNEVIDRPPGYHNAQGQ